MSWESAPIIWDEDGEPPAGLRTAIEAKMRKNFTDELCDLGSVQDLLFHLVFLSEDMDEGPTVIVYHKEGSEAFHCQYIATPEWVKVGEI